MTDPERDVIPDAAIEAAVQAAFEAGWSTEESRALALKNNPRILHGYRKIVRAALSAALPLMAGREATTPAARWRENGAPDPHGDHYDGERAALCGGNLSDDEVANEVFLNPSIGNLTAAKDRIRWLSRRLSALVPTPAAGKTEALQGVIRDAIVETATRSPGLRGPYVFDEADLQATAASIDAGKAEGNAAVAVAWQPIETAPKDGSRVILLSGSDHVFTGCWSHDADDPDDDYWSDDSGVWWEPHHWTPLPDLPPANGEGR